MRSSLEVEDIGGGERWLSSQELLLLLQRTWVPFSAPTWWLRSLCTSNPRGSDASFMSPWALHAHGALTSGKPLKHVKY